MEWTFLAFLAKPWFVIPWYAAGLAGAVLVAYDLRQTNTQLKPAMKWAWPIIILFFSVMGIVLYLGTARAPGIAKQRTAESKQSIHDRYEQNMFRRVNGAVIHLCCVSWNVTSVPRSRSLPRRRAAIALDPQGADLCTLWRNRGCRDDVASRVPRRGPQLDYRYCWLRDATLTLHGPAQLRARRPE